jgi:glycosyltransferase involved in cell wall biosynthesis
MRDPELVSVIMPVYRGERYVAAAIESVLAQTYRSFELVIVNDGSPDGSAREIARFLPNPQIRYIEQQNTGVAAARNTGIAAATGELIGLLDQDDLWLPDKLARQVTYLASHPEIGLVHSRVECIDAAGHPRSCIGAIWVHPYEGLCAGRMLLGSGIAPVTVLVRSTCIEDVGGFDQRFAPADDWELWMRVARRHSLGFLDEVTARYRFHGQNISGDQLIMQRTIVKVMDAICERFPDVPKSVSPTKLALARSVALCRAAEALEERGESAEARMYWKESYKTSGDIEDLMALLGISAQKRLSLRKVLEKTPRLRRIFSWYLYKACTRFLIH